MMKAINCRLSGVALLLTALGSSAAGPPNDNFSNRTVLTGNWVTASGSLAGATKEQPYEVGSYPGWTVWWSWTATESLPVTLIIEGGSGKSSFGGWYDDNVLNVWLPPDLSFGFPTNLCPGGSASCLVVALPIHSGDSTPNVTFTSTAGATYQIQLNGTITNDFRFWLIATNSPIIVEQPKSVTVSPGASALFTIIAIGLRPLGYRWQFNGNDLPGETSPMLALTNVSGAQAGSYAVIVTNATSMALSDAAILGVHAEQVPSQLAALRSPATNRFEFQLCGDAGRFYRIESSTNLLNWQAEKSFADPRSQNFVSSVVFASNSCPVLGLPIASSRKYFRAQRYAPTNEVCNVTMKQIRFAKELWVRDGHHSSTEYAQTSDLSPYFKHGVIDPCPSGGIHYFNHVRTLPTCSIPGHALEEPR